jgi:hypothetical protein
MRKLILNEQEFQVQEIPLEESPGRVTISHNHTRFASTADTKEDAWKQLINKLTEHYKMKVVIKSDVG